MNDSILVALVVIGVLLLLFSLSRVDDSEKLSTQEHWRGDYNPVGRGPRGGWDNRSYRSGIQPISYSGWGPYYRPIHRYVPVFDSDSSVEPDITGCIEACSTKNGEEYQECLRLCRDVYPTFSVV